MKKLAAIVAGAALVAFAAACSTETNTNAVNENRAVVNANANANAVANNNAAAPANANATTHTYNANISREEYNKDKERYGREAKEKGESIGQGLEDGWLWVKTKGKLATVDDLRDSTINVDVANAVVTLRGSVANAAQKKKAEDTAKSVSGVKSVVNQLTVNANAGVLTNSNNSNNANHNAANHNK
jgi:osmotically-inducible protein OsmY